MSDDPMLEAGKDAPALGKSTWKKSSSLSVADHRKFEGVDFDDTIACYQRLELEFEKLHLHTSATATAATQTSLSQQPSQLQETETPPNDKNECVNDIPVPAGWSCSSQKTYLDDRWHAMLIRAYLPVGEIMDQLQQKYATELKLTNIWSMGDKSIAFLIVSSDPEIGNKVLKVRMPFDKHDEEVVTTCNASWSELGYNLQTAFIEHIWEQHLRDGTVRSPYDIYQAKVKKLRALDPAIKFENDPWKQLLVAISDPHQMEDDPLVSMFSSWVKSDHYENAYPKQHVALPLPTEDERLELQQSWLNKIETDFRRETLCARYFKKRGIPSVSYKGPYVTEYAGDEWPRFVWMSEPTVDGIENPLGNPVSLALDCREILGGPKESTETWQYLLDNSWIIQEYPLIRDRFWEFLADSAVRLACQTLDAEKWPATCPRQQLEMYTLKVLKSLKDAWGDEPELCDMLASPVVMMWVCLHEAGEDIVGSQCVLQSESMYHNSIFEKKTQRVVVRDIERFWFDSLLDTTMLRHQSVISITKALRNDWNLDLIKDVARPHCGRLFEEAGKAIGKPELGAQLNRIMNHDLRTLYEIVQMLEEYVNNGAINECWDVLCRLHKFATYKHLKNEYGAQGFYYRYQGAHFEAGRQEERFRGLYDMLARSRHGDFR